MLPLQNQPRVTESHLYRGAVRQVHHPPALAERFEVLDALDAKAGHPAFDRGRVLFVAEPLSHATL
jgi:hypothetical protein